MVGRSAEVPGGAARPWMRSGFHISLALFGLAVLVTVWNFAASTADRDRVALQNRIVMALERLLSAARDMETGSRGFVLVGEDRYLEPYNAAMASLSGAEAEVRTAWSRSGGTPKGLDPLFATVEQKRRYTMELVEARQTRGFGAAQTMALSNEGKRTMDIVRAEVADKQADAETIRGAIEHGERVRSLLLTAASTILALAACAYLGWLAWQRRRMVQSTAAELAGLGDRFGTVADNMPQLAWMADRTGDIFWYNKRWYDYTGTSAEDMRNWGWQKLHDPDYVEGVTERFKTALASGEEWEDTFPLRGRDGEFRWFLSRAQPVRAASGEIVRWFGTNTDVTEQRRQEEALEAAMKTTEDANRAKSQFIANMSHELRTPLSAVIGYSEMLEEELEDLGEARLLDDLGKIKSNARHLLSLINDVLDISKIEANKMEMFGETFEVADMVRDVAATVGSLVEKKGNRLVLDTPDDLGAMHSDIVKIRQVLINLLSNAAKFTEGGEIRLGARRRRGPGGDDLVFTVRDTGLGMTEEQVAKLFQRFTQADASTTRKFGGTGLGLAITKAFAQMLGGGVAVESRAGEGSTFTITIPAELPAAEPAPEEAPEADGSEEDVVLVIDDDPATRDLLTRFLAREGFAVRVAEDGRSGLALASSLKPRVILLDVTMPRMDGWTVLRSLKDDPHLAAIPVVMCTVIDEQNLGFSLGASDYVVKPVDWDKLKTVLSRVWPDAAKGDVLVVDDDPDTRTRLDAILARDGWTVTEAANGIEALAAARQRRPSVVLLDLNMPQMDGFTFLREFRSAPDWVDVPVVVMTARDLSAGERAELKGGGARVLEKGRVGLPDLVAQLRILHPGKGGAPRPRAAPETVG